MCGAEGSRLQYFSFVTPDDSGEIVFTLGEMEQVSRFDKVRVSWNLEDTTGDMDVQAVVLYSQDGVTFVSVSTIGAPDDTTGLKVRDLDAPDGTFKYALYGVSARKGAGSSLDVESGCGWVQVEFR